MRICLAMTLTGATLLGGFSPTAAADDAGVELADERWEELAYGLSLRPPAGAAQIEHASDDELVSFLVGEDIRLSVHLRRARSAVNVQRVEQRALEQFAYAYPSAVAAGESEEEAGELELAGRPATRFYMAVPGSGGGEDWIAAQAFVMIDPYTVAMIQMQATAHSYQRARDTFEAVLGSIELEDPDAINARREAEVAAAEQWLETLTADAIRDTAEPQQWYRITQEGEDVGYQLLELDAEAEELGEPGVGLRTVTRIVAGNYVYDTAAEYFLSSDGDIEVWSIRTTQRDADQQQGIAGFDEIAGEQSWADTGFRIGGTIQQTREGPTRIDEHSWETPPTAYMPQLALQLFHRMLPRESVQMSFYAYHPDAERIALRSVRVEPSEGGGYRVVERPTLSRPAQVSIYDEDRRLVERRMADGRVFQHTTADTIERIWRD